jgi:hypothetical protein
METPPFLIFVRSITGSQRLFSSSRGEIRKTGLDFLTTIKESPFLTLEIYASKFSRNSLSPTMLLFFIATSLSEDKLVVKDF